MSRISSLTDTTGFMSPHSTWVGGGGGGVGDEQAAASSTAAHAVPNTAEAAQNRERSIGMSEPTTV